MHKLLSSCKSRGKSRSSMSLNPGLQRGKIYFDEVCSEPGSVRDKEDVEARRVAENTLMLSVRNDIWRDVAKAASNEALFGT